MVLYCDELGTMPPFDILPLFSAGRSRKLTLVPIIQSLTSLISKQDFYAVQSERFVEETFSGSLPAFLAAFTTHKKLSDAEINELQELINQSRG